MPTVEYAPTLEPTESQFADPIRYLSSPEVIKLGEKYGVLKVRPPVGWRPKFALDKDTFKFHTRFQTLKELSLVNRSRDYFWQGFNNYLRMKGKAPLKASKNRRKGRKGSKRSTDSNAAGSKEPVDYDGFVSLKDGRRTHIYDIFLSGNFEQLKPQVYDHSQEMLHDLERYSKYVKRQLAKPSETTDSLDRMFAGQEGPLSHTGRRGRSCAICHSSGGDGNKTLMCDGCDRAFHMACLDPPLKTVPKNDWFCDECLEGTNGDYGFEEDFDNIFTLKEFEEDCAEFKEDYCKDHLHGDQNPSIATLEKEFWSLVSGKPGTAPGSDEDTVEVRYGADIHKEDPAEISGFPTSTNPLVDTEKEDYYVNHFFNLTKLPFAKGSLLNYIKSEDRDKISGMTVPWIYVGSMFSTFCWHKEDHYTMSANYCHQGAVKKWYGIPASDCDQFEHLCKEMSPDSFKKQPDLMHQLVTLISPDEINQANRREQIKSNFTANDVHVYTIDQGPNEFAITFPKVYHAGFNCGFNVNEAVNFTMPYWLQFGEESIGEYREVKKENVFNHYKLLRNIMDTTLDTSEDLKKAYETFHPQVVAWMIRRAFGSYYNSVARHAQTLGNEQLDSAMKDMVHKNYREFLAVKKEKELEKELEEKNDGRKRRGRMRRIKQEEEDAEENPDEYICHDCKSFVNFQWVEIDLLKLLAPVPTETGAKGGHKLDKVEVKMEPGTEDLETDQLPTPQQSPEQDQQSKFEDTESEWAQLIERAKKRGSDEKAEEDEDNDEKNKRRRLRRKVTPVTREVIDVEEDPEETRRRRMVTRMTQKRHRHENYGKLVLCLDCLTKELEHLDGNGYKKLLKSAVLFDDSRFEELREYLIDRVQPKIAAAGIQLQ